MTTVPAEPSVAAGREVRKGLMLMALGIAGFSILNAVVKQQALVFPINQIVFFRNVFALIPVLAMMASMGGVRLMATRQPGFQLLYAGTFSLMLVSAFMGYRVMPLADATAILFAAPLIVVALAGVVLGERVGWAAWLAVLVGFAGVLIMVQPGGQGMSLGFAYLAGAACVIAINHLQQRRLSLADHAVTILFWTLGLSSLLFLPTLFVSWVQPTGPQLAGLIGMGLFTGLCQYLTTRAFHFAAASTLAPVQYTMMLWSILLGIVWFGDIPTAPVLIGAAIVIASAAIVLRRTAAA